MRIFLAGATGAIGERLVPLLVAGGHQVVATTRTPAKLERLRAGPASPRPLMVVLVIVMVYSTTKRRIGALEAAL
jgi:uncharacterized protein YbjT (DUF2867 family)